MKLEVEVTIPAVEAHTVIKYGVKCDLCGENALYDGRSGNQYSYSCISCDRDICKMCTEDEYDEIGDYPSHYCKTCHKLRFATYGDQYEQARNLYETTIEDLDARVKSESLEKANTQEEAA